MNTLTRLLVLLTLTLACLTPASAEVYKRTNPDGSVTFTDVPSKQNEDIVPLSPMSTFKAPVAPPVRSNSTTKTTPGKYTAISITSPADDSAIRDNAGNLTVNVSLTPGLQSGHTLVLLVDGAQQGKSASGSFALSNLDRGNHSLVAQVVDKEGTTIISATAVTIHLQRTSVIRPKSSFK
jgi:hypothetical protein